jgi:hypothetical protein
MSRSALAACDGDIVCAWANRNTIIAGANVQVAEGYVVGATNMNTICVFAVTRCHDFEIFKNKSLAVMESDMEEFAVFECEVVDYSSNTPHEAHGLDANI